MVSREQSKYHIVPNEMIPYESYMICLLVPLQKIHLKGGNLVFYTQKNYSVSLKGANEIIYLVFSRKGHPKATDQLLLRLQTNMFVDIFVVDFACTKAICNNKKPMGFMQSCCDLIIYFIYSL